MSSADTAIRISNVTKDFGRFRAVDDLSLEIKKGDVFGFLGRNGAGKSTAIRVMLGLMWPTEGHVEIMGHRLDKEHNLALSRVGGIVESPSFYEYLSGRKNLEIIAGMSGDVSPRRVDEVIELVGLKGREQDRVRVYSQGMRQRLGIALSLLPRSELIILDEPTEGLDPQGMRDVRCLIHELARNQGVTVFLSSHLLYEVEQICNRVAIIDAGRLVVEGEVCLLIGANEAVRIALDRVADARVELDKLEYLSVVSDDDTSLKVKMDPGDIPRLNRFLVQKGFEVRGLAREKESLEEFFLNLTSTAGQ